MKILNPEQWCHFPEPSWLPDEESIQRHFKLGSIMVGYKVGLARHMARFLPGDEALSLLDVGAGDGVLGSFFARYRSRTTVQGVEIKVRTHAASSIQVGSFDGVNLAFPDLSFDVVVLSNVLHHAAEAEKLLLECCRVARKSVLIKDHIYFGRWQWFQLAFLDWLGNARFGVAVPANYLSKNEWEKKAERAGGQWLFFDSLPLRKGAMKMLFSNNLEVFFVVRLSDI